MSDLATIPDRELAAFTREAAIALAPLLADPKHRQVVAALQDAMRPVLQAIARPVVGESVATTKEIELRLALVTALQSGNTKSLQALCQEDCIRALNGRVEGRSFYEITVSECSDARKLMETIRLLKETTKLDCTNVDALLKIINRRIADRASMVSARPDLGDNALESWEIPSLADVPAYIDRHLRHGIGFGEVRESAKLFDKVSDTTTITGILKYIKSLFQDGSKADIKQLNYQLNLLRDQITEDTVSLITNESEGKQLLRTLLNQVALIPQRSLVIAFTPAEVADKAEVVNKIEATLEQIFISLKALNDKAQQFSETGFVEAKEIQVLAHSCRVKHKINRFADLLSKIFEIKQP